MKPKMPDAPAPVPVQPTPAPEALAQAYAPTPRRRQGTASLRISRQAPTGPSLGAPSGPTSL